MFTFPGEVLHLDKFYFAEGDGLTVGEGKEVAFYLDTFICNGDVFVVVEDLLFHGGLIYQNCMPKIGR